MAVYFIQAREYGRHIKIGKSDDVGRRLKSFGSLPFEWDLLAIVPGGLGTERMLHHALRLFRVRGEWFEAAEPVEKLAAYFAVRKQTAPPTWKETQDAIDGARVERSEPVLAPSPSKKQPKSRRPPQKNADRAGQRERFMSAWMDTNIAIRGNTLARFTRVSHATIVNFVTGNNRIMSEATARKLAETFCVRTEWLRFGNGPKRTDDMRVELARRADEIPSKFRRVMYKYPNVD